MSIAKPLFLESDIEEKLEESLSINCDNCFDKPDSEFCVWPCPKTNKNKAMLHFSKCAKIQDPSRNFQPGVESVVLHNMISRNDIQLAFANEKSYGTTLMKINSFLELEYPVRCNVSNEILRDRLWITENVGNLNDYCLVPLNFQNELKILRDFKLRCKNQEIQTLIQEKCSFQ